MGLEEEPSGQEEKPLGREKLRSEMRGISWDVNGQGVRRSPTEVREVASLRVEAVTRAGLRATGTDAFEETKWFEIGKLRMSLRLGQLEGILLGGELCLEAAKKLSPPRGEVARVSVCSVHTGT